jgi:peptidoglycan/LPS O-acetylase OafA/YrhL
MAVHRAPVIHSGTRLPVLDGVRGVAIALVVIYHSIRFGGMQPTVALDRVVQKLGAVGWSGVDLFFVLSGFLITGILYDAKHARGYFRNFYARRILRIFPLYYGFLFVAFVLWPLLSRWTGVAAPIQAEQLWYWTYLQNVAVAIKGWPVTAGIEHFWSLAVEEQFYLVWPLLVLALERRALVLACLAIGVGSLSVRALLVESGHPIAAYVLTPSRLDPLAFGALLALIARTPGALPRAARWARPVAGACALCLGSMFFWRHGLHFWDRIVETIGFTLLAVLFGAVLAVALASPPRAFAARVLAHPTLQLLGRYSYAMYVFHLPIILSVAHAFSAATLPRLAGSQLPGQMGFTSVTAMLTLYAARWSWRLYEAPLLRLKALFPYGDGMTPAGLEGIRARPGHAA